MQKKIEKVGKFIIILISIEKSIDTFFLEQCRSRKESIIKYQWTWQSTIKKKNLIYLIHLAWLGPRHSRFPTAGINHLSSRAGNSNSLCPPSDPQSLSCRASRRNSAMTAPSCPACQKIWLGPSCPCLALACHPGGWTSLG